MTRHETEHRYLAKMKAELERDTLIAEALPADDEESYIKRACARANLNVYVRPKYTALLQAHIEHTHDHRIDEAWPYAEELEGIHDGLHEKGMPPCSTNELEAEQDIGALLEASLVRRGRLVP
jgi:hypothetical protein